uniref:Large ribosomal subunit protein bL9m n=1 Tax=Canis lupus dingo TaxID=286419 RepID=A0A8C0KBQ0_CANLU
MAAAAGLSLLLRRAPRGLLLPRLAGAAPGPERDFSLSHSRGTVIVERWWQVPLAGEGRKPRLHRRHRVYRLVEDTKHGPRGGLELILTRSVEGLGVRGDLVSVKKSLGRNRLLPQGLAVYASPENKKLFEEEKLVSTKEGRGTWRNRILKFLLATSFPLLSNLKMKWGLQEQESRNLAYVQHSKSSIFIMDSFFFFFFFIFNSLFQLRQEGKLEKIQTRTGEMTVKFLRSCHLEVGMKNNIKWELNPEIVARHFFKNLGVVVAPHALKLPEEPITRWGEYWCEVTVNGLDTVRVPMSVVKFERPKTKRYKYWLAQQAAKGMAPTNSQTI